MDEQGFIHVYTGSGKGKTTAAIGLALRAAGAGKKVFIAQFIKGLPYAEMDILAQVPNVKLKQYGRGCFITKKPEQEDIEAAEQGWREVSEMIFKNLYDVIILDEICVALYFHLLKVKDVVSVLKQKPYGMEIVLTGRYAPSELIELADLVTEMQEIKHYYHKGVKARKGIEY
jgi:cob(I)alamin adenosyltransferase